MDAYLTGRWVAQCSKNDRFEQGRVAHPSRIDRCTDSNADAPTREDGDGFALQGMPAPIPESDVLRAVLGVCNAHPRVAWAERMNTGAMKKGPHYVRFGFPGLSDVIGQLRDGRFLAIETKRVGKKATTEQLEFLGKVSRAGGLAFVAWSAADAVRGLDELEAA